MKNLVAESIKEHIEIVNSIDKETITSIKNAASVCGLSLKKGNKIMFIGNGGSAGDAQHLATELIVRYEKNRRPLRALALTTDTSLITACSNDFSFDKIFSRQIEGLGKRGDILFAISTSGKSKNVIEGCKIANKMGIKVISLTGKSKNTLINKYSDLVIRAPSYKVSRIQECHIMFGQIICELLEKNIK